MTIRQPRNLVILKHLVCRLFCILKRKSMFAIWQNANALSVLLFFVTASLKTVLTTKQLSFNRTPCVFISLRKRLNTFLILENTAGQKVSSDSRPCCLYVTENKDYLFQVKTTRWYLKVLSWSRQKCFIFKQSSDGFFCANCKRVFRQSWKILLTHKFFNHLINRDTTDRSLAFVQKYFAIALQVFWASVFDFRRRNLPTSWI